MSAAQPIPFALPFSHYAKLGYHPIPVVWGEKKPAGGDGWNTKVYTSEQYAELDVGQYSVGLLCDNIVGIDIDVTNKRLADRIETVCLKSLGLSKSVPRRVGKAPKRMLIVRVAEPVKGWDLLSKQKGVRGRGETLFQLLGSGKQFVVHGLHPQTKKPYTLDRPLPPWSKLPLVTSEQLDEMRIQVGTVLIEAGFDVTGTQGGQVKDTGKFSHTRWRSDAEFDRVLAALRKISPELPRVPWFNIACALHDGTHGDEDGFDLFHMWSSGALHGYEVPKPKYRGQVDCWRTWRGIKAGKGVTTGTLFHVAEKGEWGPEPVEEGPADAPQSAQTSAADDGWTLADLVASPPVTRWWLVQDMLTVGAHLLVGRPKGGKSWWTMSLALAVGNGECFLDRPTSKADVLWVAAEDDRDSLVERLQLIRARPTRSVDVFTMERLRAERAKYEEDYTLITWLGDYLAEHADCRLVLLDTHSTVKREWDGAPQRSSESVTEQAYQLSRECEVLAKQYGVCIILLHHSRKRNGDNITDYHELINMAQTVVAGATASIVLADHPDAERPDDPRRVLAVRGRHLRDQQLLIEFGASGFVTRGDYFEVQQTEAESAILSALEAILDGGDRWVTTREIVDQLDGPKIGAVKNTLLRMEKAGRRTWKQWRIERKAGKGGGIRLVL